MAAPQRPPILHRPSRLHRNHRQGQEAGHSSAVEAEQPPVKRPRTSSPHLTAKSKLQDKVESNISKNGVDPVENWVLSTKWPGEFFQPDSQTIKDFFNHDSWLDEPMEQSSIHVVQYVEIDGKRYPRPIMKVQASVRRRPSETSFTGSSNQKTTPYRDNRYETLLEAKGSYMTDCDIGISNTSRTWCTRLLSSTQTVPEDSLFRDDRFGRTCNRIRNRNVARVIQDIARLIVPSAENLATDEAKHLDSLIENVNEAWTECIPLEGPRPQPDFSVGFQRAAFTDDQQRRLGPFVGSVYDTSFFVATFQMYFPFLTCEVTYGDRSLVITERKNAHSMTLAVRGVIELFRLVGREKELHQEILAFSVSHDHRSVWIYGHYALIDGVKTTYYQHPIHSFNFTTRDGRDKWTAYKFTKNIYDLWMPAHLERICSVIDQLPNDLSFDVSCGSELQFVDGLEMSQVSGSLLSEEADIDSALPKCQDDHVLALTIAQNATPDTSVSRDKMLVEPKALGSPLTTFSR